LTWRTGGALKFKVIKITAISNISALSAVCPAVNDDIKTSIQEDIFALSLEELYKTMTKLICSKKSTACDGVHLQDVIFKCIYPEFPKFMNILM